MIVFVKKWGNSASVRIPRLIMKALNLKLGDSLEIKIENGRLILAKTNEFKLEDFLSGITRENLHSRLDFGDLMGKECS